MPKDELVSFSDRERALIEQVAKERGITFEEAVTELAGEGLAHRVRKKTGRGPSASVLRFRRR